MTIPCQAVVVLGPEAGHGLPKPFLPGVLSEECTTRLLSGHNTSVSAGLGKKQKSEKN